MPDNNGRLAGKVAIVTGAGSSGPGVRQRQGRRHPLRPAKEPKSCWWTPCRRGAEETLALIRAEGGEADVFAANVINADDCRRMVDAALDRWGRLGRTGQQCRHLPPWLRPGNQRRGLGLRHGRQRQEHRPLQQVRHPQND